MKPIRYIVSILMQFGALLLCIWSTGFVNAGHWGFAISVNFIFMIVFTIIFEKLVPPVFLNKYFLSKPFERNGAIYLWFGVKYYKLLLKLIGWEKIIRKNQIIKKHSNSLILYKNWTQRSEAIHLFASIYVFVFTVWIGWKYSIGDVYWLILLNIIVNVYPVMLQRYNRFRVIRLLQYKKNTMIF